MMNATPLQLELDARPFVLRDRAVLALLALVLALQGIAWWMQSGYPLADAVEFMDRARYWVQGERLGGEHTIRSFAFSVLFVPFFGLARLFQVHDLRPVLFIARGLQELIAIGFVFVCARLTARLAGRRAGLAAIVFVGANPFFLLYSSWPVSGLAAALFVALGIERLLQRSTFRGEWIGGLLLGAGFLIAYQTLLVILAVALAMFLRDRFKHAGSWLGVFAGLAVAVSVQVVLDRIVYGEWGGSVWRYFLDNFAPTLTTWLLHLGLRDAARVVYQFESDLRGFAFDVNTEGPTTHTLMPRTWYLVNLHQMFVIPVLVCLVVGAISAVRAKLSKLGLLALVFGVNLLVMSFKGDKSFRLWLPLIPMVVPIAALGFARLFGDAGSRFLAPRRLIALALVGATIALGPVVLAAQSPRYHGVYWEAMDYINREAQAAKLPSDRRLRIASAYYWAVFLRNDPAVEVQKLPFSLDVFGKLSPEERNQVISTLDSLDGLIVHLPVLTGQPELFKAVNERFRVRAAFYDQRVHAGLGPVFVLERQRTVAKARHFFESEKVDDLDAYRTIHKLGRSTSFVRENGDHDERLTLLGFETEPIAGSDFQWITYHWYAATDLAHDFRIVDRVTSPDNLHSWHNNHFPAYGVLPSSTWKQGTVVRESYLLVASEDAFYADRPYRPLGGAFRRGNLIPARLWMLVTESDEHGNGEKQLEVREEGAEDAVRKRVSNETLWSPSGWRFSRGGLVQVGAFFLPVHPTAKLLDDGKPLPD